MKIRSTLNGGVAEVDNAEELLASGFWVAEEAAATAPRARTKRAPVEPKPEE